MKSKLTTNVKLLMFPEEFMKEDTIVKINKIGKAGDIVARILRILLIIAFVAVLAGLIVLSVLPGKLVKVDLGSQVGIVVDFSDFGEISEEEQAELRKSFEEMNKGEEDEAGRPSNVEVTSTTLSFEIGQARKVFGLRDLIGPVIVAMFYIVGSYVILWFVALLCRAFRDCNSPLEDNVIRRMKNFAFAIIAWGVLAIVCNIVISSIFVATQIRISFGLGHILLVLAILGLCGIFRYGATLQKEHDETL